MKKLLSIILACFCLTAFSELLQLDYVERNYSWTCTYCNTQFNVNELWWRTIRLDNFGYIVHVGCWHLKQITDCPYCGRRPYWETGRVPMPPKDI